MDLDTLRAEVDDAFVSTSEGLSPWPARRGFYEEPREEEYSRCLDPAKFRLIGARADAWVEVLAGRGWASVERSGPTTVVTPTRAGALPLKVARSAIDDVPDAAVTLSIATPPLEIILLPTCGCDACDEGSGPELTELDERIFHVVSGAFVHVKGRRGDAMSTHESYEGSGDIPVEEWLAVARAGGVPRRTTVTRGAAWWE